MRVVRFCSGFIAAGIVGVFVAPAVLAFAGLRPLAVHGGSMAPTLRSGDTVIVRNIPARILAVGDIVTLPGWDPWGPMVTHRLIARSEDGGAINVTTKGDASAGSESWLLDAEDQVGRLVVRVPTLGHISDFLSLPLTRAALISIIAVLFMTTGGCERPTEKHPT